MQYNVFDKAERVTVGTIGEVGQRVFLLQVRQALRQLTLKLEKQQVAALAEYLGVALRELPRPGHLPEQETLELEEPTEPEWVIGTIGIEYDSEADAVVLSAEEAVMEDEDPAIARIYASREQVAALAIRCAQLVEAGRPACPICSYPLDPAGHNCPRTNGHRPPIT